MMTDVQTALRDFNQTRKFDRKGALCVALVITQHARKGLPLDANALLTEGGGQVLGLGRGAVQAVLHRHGITRRLASAEVLAENAGLGERIDMFEAEQFIALNLYELGKFAADGRRVAVNDVVTRYNDIVEEVETDPSLKIECRG